MSSKKSQEVNTSDSVIDSESSHGYTSTGASSVVGTTLNEEFVNEPVISFGALPSPPDYRDHIAEKIYKERKRGMRRLRKTTFPNTLDFRPLMQTIVNQGLQGTCAAQTAVAMKEYQERIEVDLKHRLSAQFIYNLRSNYPESGMFGRDVMKILTDHGVCLENTYIYGRVQEADEIPQNARDEAANYKIKEYARVETLEGLKESLYRNGPCYISFPVYNSGGNFWIKREGDSYKGGHAVCVAGYNEKGFIIRNSWGALWNLGGCTIYPYEEWGAHYEVWTTIDGPSPQINRPNPPINCQCTIL